MLHDVLIQSKPSDVLNFVPLDQAGRAVVDLCALLLLAKELGLVVVVEAIGALAGALLIVLGTGNLSLSQEMASAVEKSVKVVLEKAWDSEFFSREMAVYGNQHRVMRTFAGRVGPEMPQVSKFHEVLDGRTVYLTARTSPVGRGMAGDGVGVLIGSVSISRQFSHLETWASPGSTVVEVELRGVSLGSWKEGEERPILSCYKECGPEDVGMLTATDRAT